MFENFKAKAANAWKSVTIWFNTLVAAIIPFSENIVQGIKDNLPTVSQYLNADTLKYIAGAILIINIGLRFKTNKSLDQK